MGKIPSGTLHNFINGEVVDDNGSAGLNPALSLLETAINGNADDIANRYTKADVDNKFSATAGGQSYSFRNGATFPTSPIKGDIFYLTSDQVVSNVTYKANRAYQYDGSSWKVFLNGSDSVSVQAVSLTPGVQTVNYNSDQKGTLDLTGINGRTLVNLLGRKGAMNSTGNTTLVNASESANTTNYVIGTQAMKYTATGATSVEHYMIIGAANHSADIVANNYYLGVAAIKPNVGQAMIRVLQFDSSNTVLSDKWGTKISDTSKFSNSYIAFQAPANAVKIEARFDILDASGATIFTPNATTAENGTIDGYRFYQLSQSDYNALSGMTSDQIAAKYPYVDDVKPIYAPYIYKYGQNLLPPFTQWTLNANAVATSDYSLTLSATTLDSRSWVRVPAIAGQSYTYSGTTSDTANGRFEGYWLDANGNILSPDFAFASGSQTITAPSGTVQLEIRITNRNTATVTLNFTNPMLNLGSTALPFEVRNDDYVFYNGLKLHSSVDGSAYDSLYYSNGVPRKVKRFQELQLDGSLGWGYDGTTTGFKQVHAAINGGVGNPNSSLVKYNGNIIRLDQTDSPLTNANAEVFNAGSAVWLTIPTADSGWGDSYPPTNAEIQAYFYGYKMNNGTFGTAYNGTGTKTWTAWNATDNTSSVTTCPTTQSSAIDGKTITYYKLVYQLASSVDESVTSEGQIPLDQGLNQVEVGCGIMVRELVTPYLSSGYYYIDGGNASAYTKYRDSRFIQVYKNENADNWIIESDTSNGLYHAKIAQANFDTTAAYEVTYLALDTYLLGSIPQTVSSQIGKEALAVIQDNTQNIADLTARVSTVENTKANKDQPPWIAPTLLNGWVNYGGIYSTAGYYKDSLGIVHLRGLIKSGTGSAGTVLFNLPIGYRPSIGELLPTLSNNASTYTPVSIEVHTDGNVSLTLTTGTTWLALSGITFRAEQ